MNVHKNARRCLGAGHQLLADALALAIPVGGQIRQIAAIGEVRYRTGDADQPAVFIPGGDGQTGVFDHGPDDVGFIDGAAFIQAGAFQNIDELVGFEAVFDGVGNGHRITRRSEC